MESVFKEQLHQLADKVENYLFRNQAELNPEQVNYFQSFFTSDSYVFSTNLIKYFKTELCIGFVFNIFLLGIFFIYIPFNFNTCWHCNSLMALWLLALTILNVILVLPKAILVQKLFRIEEVLDIYMANFAVWNFFRSKVYKFNMTMSRYIFCTYVVGTVLLVITWTAAQECDRFYGLVAFLLGSFVIRILGSFYKFCNNFGNQQQAETLFELFEGTAGEEIHKLKVTKVSEYNQEHERDDKDCPICYEGYNCEDEVRVMECPGSHAFHKKCIDKWLLKSTRCPQCNLSIFWTKEQAKKND